MPQDKLAKSLYSSGIKRITKRGYGFVSEAADIFRDMCGAASENIAKTTNANDQSFLNAAHTITVEFADAFILEADKDRIKRIGVAHIKRARIVLCPLWPFC